MNTNEYKESNFHVFICIHLYSLYSLNAPAFGYIGRQRGMQIGVTSGQLSGQLSISNAIRTAVSTGG